MRNSLNPPRRAPAMLALAALVLSGAASASQETPAARMPVPEAEKQKEAERTLRRLFKEEYEKKSVADRRALAAALLESALKGQDEPAFRYTLLKEAREISAQAGDLETAIRSIEATARIFEVEAPPLKLAVLAGASKAARAPEEWAGLAARHLALADEAAILLDYESAEKAVQAAAAQARRAGDPGLSARATTRSKEISELKNRYEKVRKARETLLKNPSDSSACLEYGRFMCLDNGVWEQGLPFLAKGSDATLAGLAEKDLANPSTPADQTKMGLAWLMTADKEKGERKDRCLDRACYWYEKALAGSTGPARNVILSRIQSIPPSKRPIDLLHLVDPSRHTVFGTWTSAEGALVSDASQFARFQIPYHPPSEYDLLVTFVRLEGKEQVVVFLSQKGRGFAWAISEGESSCCAWITVKDLWNSRQNPTYAPMPGALVNGKPCTVVLEVRSNRVRPVVSGKPAGEYRGDFTDLVLPTWLELQDPEALGVGSYQSPTRVLRIELTELSGRGYRLP